MAPYGAADPPAGWTASETRIGPTPLSAPVNMMDSVPDTVPESGNEGSAATDTRKTVDPVPDAGVTRSHGCPVTAVHVTVPKPVCVIRTCWGGVLVVKT